MGLIGTCFNVLIKRLPQKLKKRFYILIPSRKVPPVAHLLDTAAPRLRQRTAHVAHSQHLEVRRTYTAASVRAHDDVLELVEGVGGWGRAARLGCGWVDGWMDGWMDRDRQRGRGRERQTLGVGVGA